MPNDKYKIRFRIEDIEYNFGTAADEPVIILRLGGFKFGENNKSFVDIGGALASKCLWLYLNKSTFSQLTDRFWNGTPEDAKRLEKLLVGKEFYLDLAMKSANKVEVETSQLKAVTT